MAALPGLPDAVRQVTREDLPRMVDVMYGAFQDDPLTLYVLLDKESRPDHPKLAQGPDMMQFLMETMFDAGAVMLQSCDWAAVAIWFPPGVSKPNWDEHSEEMPRSAIEYKEKYDKVYKDRLAGRDHWYLNYVARAKGRTDKGAVSLLMKPVMDAAVKAGVPCWLEATSEHSRRVYEHWNWIVTDEVTIGQGIVNADGWVEPNGGGIQTYGMIYGDVKPR